MEATAEATVEAEATAEAEVEVERWSKSILLYRRATAPPEDVYCPDAPPRELRSVSVGISRPMLVGGLVG